MQMDGYSIACIRKSRDVGHDGHLSGRAASRGFRHEAPKERNAAKSGVPAPIGNGAVPFALSPQGSWCMLTAG